MSPDGSPKLPPEERLLRLIRGKASQPAEVAVQSSARTVSSTIAAPSGALGHPHAAGGFGGQWQGVAIKLLAVVVACELVALLTQVFRPLPIPQVSSSTEVSVVGGPVDSADVLTQMPSLAASATRPLFAAPVELAVTAAPPKVGMSDAAKLLAARLTLMGIISGNPAQAIIEDSQTRKTYFVSAGQMVADGAVLDQVLDNRVILSLEGEKIELTM